LLTKIPQLKVAARTSSFSFKGKGVEIPEIARQLHVANVLEGSVCRSGDQLRITAQLIRAAEGYHLWSETYDRKMDDIFKIQDEIAGEVVKELKVKLLGAAPKVRTTDPKAYALFLQARELGRQANAEAFAKSDALFRQVLEIDPRYAPAWDGLASNFYFQANMGLLSNQEGYARAREAAEKALAIDPDYAPAYARLGYIADTDNNLAGAARHYQRALALDQTDLDVLRNAALFLQDLGRLDEALALEEAVVRRDPVNVTALFNLGNYQRMAGRYDAAIASFRTVLSLSPDRGNAHAQLGNALMRKGDAAAGLAEIEQEKSEVWRMNRVADGLLRARAQNRRRCRAQRADREVREGLALQHRLRLRVLRRCRQGVRVARQGGRIPRPETQRNRDGKSVRQNPFRPALAALPAQNRQGAGAAGEDRVQGDAAAMSGVESLNR
jgi:tetratricopeptide (TPR) repeat protein